MSQYWQNNFKTKNLSFFLEILNKLGLSLIEVSTNAERTPQNLYYTLKNDDSSLGGIMYLLRANGYQLIPYYKTDEQDTKMVNYELVFDENIKVKEDSSKKYSNLQQIAKSDHKLAFLADFILKQLEKRGINLSRFCEEIGIKYISLHRNFIVDDIKISTLNRISEATETKLVWSIKKVDVKKQTNTNNTSRD